MGRQFYAIIALVWACGGLINCFTASITPIRRWWVFVVLAVAYFGVSAFYITRAISA